MPCIEFFSPGDSDFVYDPESPWLRNLILTGTAEYWTAGCGQGSLRREEAGKICELRLTFIDTCGFHLEYVDSQEIHFVSLSSNNFEDSVTAFIGGEPLLLPLAYFVARDAAWNAVEYFCQTGERCDAIAWGRRRDQEWTYGQPLP